LAVPVDLGQELPPDRAFSRTHPKVRRNIVRLVMAILDDEEA
jgi:hypothetical protein